MIFRSTQVKGIEKKCQTREEMQSKLCLRIRTESRERRSLPRSCSVPQEVEEPTWRAKFAGLSAAWSDARNHSRARVYVDLSGAVDTIDRDVPMLFENASSGDVQVLPSQNMTARQLERKGQK